MGRGDLEAGLAIAVRAAAIGERFDDADLVWLARDDQGRALVKLGRLDEGLRLVDEVLVAALAGELSPIVTGIVYCNTIAFCRDAYAVRHAREWTEALSRWCDAQAGMVAHMGLCLLHRAEIMQLQGAWQDALEEARKASARFSLQGNPAAGVASYRQAEVLRLQGEFAAAEEAYRDASRHGWEPQPGMAQLRLAQGNLDTAVAAIRRAISETRAPRCCRPTSRSSWRAATSQRREPHAMSSRIWRRPLTARCSPHSPRTRGARFTWRKATPEVPWSR
jgi:tetratricopeptide (TPR) repeat protein